MIEKKILKAGVSLTLGLGLGLGVINTIETVQPTTIQAKGNDTEKRTKKIAKAINEDLEFDEAGDTTWKFNADSGTWDATLDPNSEMYQSMDEGEVSLWNSYVREIKAESKELKKDGAGPISYFQVLDPNDESKVFLQVDKGKVKYNIGEDLGN